LKYVSSISRRDICGLSAVLPAQELALPVKGFEHYIAWQRIGAEFLKYQHEHAYLLAKGRPSKIGAPLPDVQRFSLPA